MMRLSDKQHLSIMCSSFDIMKLEMVVRQRRKGSLRKWIRQSGERRKRCNVQGQHSGNNLETSIKPTIVLSRHSKSLERKEVN